jgi:gamma-glutamyl-gamma-aminobutyraldehyde dehydrogenase
MTTRINQQEIDAANRDLQFPACAFIDGSAVSRDHTFTVIDPAQEAPVCDVPELGPEAIDSAVASARRAFDHGEWKRAGVDERKAALFRLADLIESETLTLALFETRNTGKPISDAIEDIEDSAAELRWYAEASDKIYGRSLRDGDLQFGMLDREASGVVAAITPWNFPLATAIGKVGPALACGNSVILKPSELSPSSAQRLGELGKLAGLPDGILNIVTGLGATAGQALSRHGDIDVISFTGSTSTGRQLLRDAADSNLKRVWLELGGKSPNIVCGDCPDFDDAAAQSAAAIFYHQGQVCSAKSRIILLRDAVDRFMEAFEREALTWTTGPTTDLDTKVGPMVSRRQFERATAFVERAAAQGSEVRQYGGGAGLYMAPTAVLNVEPHMEIFREEVFGPIVTISIARDLDHAIELANDSHYGLAASIWTSSLATAHRATRDIRAGRVAVNGVNSGGIRTPFGGFGASGNARERSFDVFDQYLETKTIWVNLPR